MEERICLKIPLGYRLEDKIEHMKVWQAETRLLTKGARRYTKAVRNGDDAALYARYLVCPHCGKRFATNADLLPFGGVPVPRERVQEWASMQLSVFDDENGAELLLAPPIEAPSVFFCPGCETESRASEAFREVSLTREGKTVTVQCKISSLEELMASRWLRLQAQLLCFPVYEVAAFDFGRGCVTVSLMDVKGKVLRQLDVTEAPELLEGGALHKVLRQNKTLRRGILKLFSQVWDGPLPYSAEQAELPSLVQMTVFVGYPRSFYACIPYVEDSCRLDASFARQAKALHDAKDIPQVYGHSTLPPAKSVRRLMFETPGLFFYLDEISRLWEIVADHNLFCRLLGSGDAFDILCQLHMRPGIFCYLQDYCAVKGAKGLCSVLEKDRYRTLREAVDYYCMSPFQRSAEQVRWKNGSRKAPEAPPKPGYSLPMASPDPRITDCTIHGYTFFWLRSTNDYRKAADRLKNCLKEWHRQYAPVVCVKKKEKYLAAIEVSNGRIVQAYGYRNSELEDDAPLYDAFQQWVDCYGLRWEGNLDADDIDRFLEEDEDLPF